jgi:hypothetical protein
MSNCTSQWNTLQKRPFDEETYNILVFCSIVGYFGHSDSSTNFFLICRFAYLLVSSVDSTTFPLNIPEYSRTSLMSKIVITLPLR